MSREVCTQRDDGPELIVTRKENRCRYHKKGDSYPLGKLGPENLCLEAFHSAYPFCLSLLYDAQFETYSDKDSLLVHCPGSENYIVLKLSRLKVTNFTEKLSNVIRSLLNYVYPVDIRKYRILIEIIDIRGDCINKNYIGETFEFNLDKKSEICPAAFNNIYPFIDFCSREGRMPWMSEGELIQVQCPDHKANITFRYQEGKKGG